MEKYETEVENNRGNLNERAEDSIPYMVGRK